MPFKTIIVRLASTMSPKLLLYKQDASPPSCAVMMLADMLKLKLEFKEPALIKLEHKSPEFKQFAALVQGATGPTPAQIAEIEDAYSTVELYLERTPYIAADHLTVADLSVGSTALSMQGIHALDANKYPKTGAWLDKLREHESFRNISLPGAAIFKKMLENAWQRNNA